MAVTIEYIGNAIGLQGTVLGEVFTITPHGLTSPAIQYTYDPDVPFDETLLGGGDSFDATIGILGLLITVDSVGP